MRIDVSIVRQPIDLQEATAAAGDDGAGAVISFQGIVRAMENGVRISGLDYEAYDDMAIEVMRRILRELASVYPCLGATVVHRVGFVPVGEAAISMHVKSTHRAEALHLLEKFMDQLKRDVPIWKVEARPDLADCLTA